MIRGSGSDGSTVRVLREKPTYGQSFPASWVRLQLDLRRKMTKKKKKEGGKKKRQIQLVKVSDGMVGMWSAERTAPQRSKTT